ncbi:MAG: ribose transport system ATP-binding protein [Chloroflexota bacterium]|nr:ribose transport system ATP-binding protein [Chloroflexota bacterium]
MNNCIPLLEMKAISKSFPGVKALDHVSFDLFPGEVHVLVGENGAGKSTLMKVLAGAYPKDEGEIFIKGDLQPRWSPTAARAQGVAMVYQEFTLLPFRSVAENIFLGRERTVAGLFLDKASMLREAARILQSIGVDVNPQKPVMELGVAEQQMVEIAKALAMDARILVLDEPTSALSLHEIEQLFSTVEKLKANGVGIIYISHRMEELKQIGDRVTVMRDGQLIGTREVADVSIDEVITMMIGREINELFPRHHCQPGEVALSVKGLKSGKKVHHVDLELHFGEIVGLSGLVGSGRTETARAIFGLDPMTADAFSILGKSYKHIDPSLAVDIGVGLIPEDRRRDGLFPILSMEKNLVMVCLRKLFPKGVMRPSLEKKTAGEYVRKFDIQPPSLERIVHYLSGGNQQKVVIGKWLAAKPRVIIIDEPTRGIDVGAKSEVHAFMDQLANSGHAILMISSEMPEILGMSDRIYVMHEGRVAGEFQRGTESEEILRCAMGV